MSEGAPGAGSGDAPVALDCSVDVSRGLDSLAAGMAVELTGPVLTLRDASAARLVRALDAGGRPPVLLEGRVLYAVGPSPARPGQIIGAAGPTTTARMARHLPALFEAGVRAVVGKGEIHGPDMAAFTRHRAVYLAAVGGLGALLARHVAAASVVAYGELGPEAVYELRLDAFPCVVVIDRRGRNLHEEARSSWRRRG